MMMELIQIPFAVFHTEVNIEEIMLEFCTALPLDALRIKLNYFQVKKVISFVTD